MSGIGEQHRITAKKLRELLNELDDGYEVYPNEVQNLAIMRGNMYLGYIDLAFERVEWSE